MRQIDDFQLTNLLIKMYANSAEAIFFFDRSGKVIAMNNAAELILDVDVLDQMAKGREDALCLSCKGYTSEQELQTCLSCYLVDPKGDFSSFQVYLQTRGKGVIPYTASFQTIDQENGIRIFMLRDLSTQFKTMKTLNEKTMLKNVIKAQEGERKRISRELHDSVAQEMISSLVDLRVLKYMNVGAAAMKKIMQIEGSLMRLLDDIRHLSVELRPAVLDDLGLEAAFRTHFKWLAKNYGFIVEFTAELEAKRYEDEIETVVYRVCQEAVFNALKYANVHSVTVRLYEEGTSLHLQITDEGKGFNINEINPEGTGLGLYGMRERAELVEGQLIIETEVGKGTSIHLHIRLPTEMKKKG